MDADTATLLAEYAERIERQRKAEAFTDTFLTKPQHRWKDDKSQFRLAMCSRRAGKTVVAAWEMIDCARTYAASNCIYIALTRRSAKDLIWETLETLLKRFAIEHETNMTELSITFPNGSRIELAGCEDERKCARLLGRNFRRIYIDESQAFGYVLGVLIDKYLAPMLIDDPESQLALMGTPPARKSGAFYDNYVRALKGLGWSLHQWTMADNEPMLKGRKAADIIAAEAKRRGVTIDDPTIQREYFGRIVQDEAALIFPLTAANYDTNGVPGDLTNFVIGIDLGFTDSDAISVLGWHDSRPELWLVEEDGKAEQTIQQLLKRLERLMAKYNPIAMVGDEAGGGKKTVASLNAAFNGRAHILAAEKTEKVAHVQMLRDAVRSGQFKCKPDSKFADEAAVLEWAYNSDGHKIFPTNVRKLGRHFDFIHSVLYGWRRVRHYQAVPEAPPPDDATIMKALRAAQVRKATSDDPYEDGGGFGDYCDTLFE